MAYNLPQLPENIENAMQNARFWTEQAIIKNPSPQHLEDCQKNLVNVLAFLWDRMVDYQYFFNKAKEEFEAAQEDIFNNIKLKNLTDGVATNESKRLTKNEKHKKLEAEYLYKKLKVFCEARKDIVTSIIHCRKDKQNEIKSGFGD